MTGDRAKARATAAKGSHKRKAPTQKQAKKQAKQAKKKRDKNATWQADMQGSRLLASVQGAGFAARDQAPPPLPPPPPPLPPPPGT